ncbi:MAG TPA: sugar ABC transporter permease [Jatrophihabitans sp.]|nr:sugar ABC transporter permease [Jatrophihabitans sp.]
MRTRRWTPYAYLLPTLAFLGVVFGYAVVAVVLESFRVPGLLGVMHWGRENYHGIFHDPLFWQSLRDNLKLFLVIPAMTVVGLVVAVLLFERIKGWRIYRSLAFLPYILAVPIVGVVFSYILERNGVLNQMLDTLHLHFLVHDWLGNPDLALWSIAVIIAWQQTGLAIVLFLARLASVDEQLYEAALTDGANWFQRFWHITMPQLARVIEFFVTISLINMLSWVFSYVYVMTGGGPQQKSYVTELYIYQNAFRNGLSNLASAASVILLLVATAVLFVQAVTRKAVDRIEV